MTSLQLFNSTLRELRDAFHKSGRFNDSNEKLDEISKLLAIQLHDLTHNDKGDWIPALLNRYDRGQTRLVPELKKKFKQVAKDPIFQTSDGHAIFGAHPSIHLDDKDDEFAFRLLSMIVQAIDGIRSRGEKFDFLNEAFGYFVRDNFRNNVEDAQYMTPHEIVDFMCEIGLFELKEAMTRRRNLVVCDPCCGVGSFLSVFSKKIRESDHKANVHLVGQDKVPRMVRFAKLNMSLFNASAHEIFRGNSVIGDTPLQRYQGKVDLILTNPPFGARFTGKELSSEPSKKYPLLNDLFDSSLKFNSEVLFVDLCISLLRDGGQMLAVVPDSVISSKGVAESLRHRIITSDSLELMSIVELPTIAFAQAGTRTKTSILHVKKSQTKKHRPVFIAKSNDLGFDVSTRRGVNVKVLTGENDLPRILESYAKGKRYDNVKNHKIIGSSPSAVLVNRKVLTKNPWTPNHYEAAKLQVVDSLRQQSTFDLVPLSEIAEVITGLRKKDKRESHSRCISVLHVVNNDLLDYDAMLNYDPKYPGIVCRPGDLLFSKINPRIPRIIVVPDLGYPLTCSSEFEILQARNGFSNYELKTLLLLPSVQVQINHLTSGTSSSHNRIKTDHLLRVQVPVPKKSGKVGAEFYRLLQESTEIYQNAFLLNIKKMELSNALSKWVKL